jgi:putative transposase
MEIIMNPDQGYSALKKGRVSLPNHAYHIVFSTKDRRHVFTNLSVCRSFIKLLVEDERRKQTRTLAYVVMPDHIHWLMFFETGTLSSAVKRIKSLSSRCIEGLQWNTGFYDHLIRDDENLRNTARYIVANPLRAGLVDSVRDYGYWDAVWI